MSTYAQIIDVKNSHGGFPLQCDEVSISRRTPDQWTSESDALGLNVDSFEPDDAGFVELTISKNQVATIEYLSRIAEAVDAAKQAGTNPGLANPDLPGLFTDSSSGTQYGGPARLMGHPRDGMGFSKSGLRTMTFVFRVAPMGVRNRGYTGP